MDFYIFDTLFICGHNFVQKDSILVISQVCLSIRIIIGNLSVLLLKIFVQKYEKENGHINGSITTKKQTIQGFHLFFQCEKKKHFFVHLVNQTVLLFLVNPYI